MDSAPPPDLSHAGAVVDQAIAFMVGQDIGSLEIASALLGGSLGLMARTMAPEAIARVLHKALDSVAAGAVHRMDGPAQ